MVEWGTEEKMDRNNEGKDGSEYLQAVRLIWFRSVIATLGSVNTSVHRHQRLYRLPELSGNLLLFDIN